MDIYKVLKDKLARLDDPNKIYTARGKSKRTVEIRTTPYVYKSGVWQSRSWIETENAHIARACVHYKVISPPTLSDLLGLSPKFIPETMWELTSLSFVWDWFLQLGMWLSALRGAVDWNYQILGNTVSMTILTSGVGRSEQYSQYDEGCLFNTTSAFKAKQYERAINEPLPLPGFRASIDLNLWKHADLIIIASQFLPKQLKKDFFNSFAGVLLKQKPKYTE